jgi:hypothetical protein
MLPVSEKQFTEDIVDLIDTRGSGNVSLNSF